MRNKINKIISKSILIVLMIGIFFVFSSCKNKENINYINSSEDFFKAIQSGTKNIYVDDIVFNSDAELNINYHVNIIGKDEKSIFENLHIVVNGSNVPSEILEISIKNIIFDGKNDKNKLPLVEGSTFSETFDGYKMYHCINGSIGYSSINIDNCEIRNYLSEDGPAIYINNDANYRNGKKILSLTNSKIYNNISNAGTVKVFSDVLTTNISDCEFYGNLARAAQGIAVGNGKSLIQNTTIHDNDFFRFVYYMEKRMPNIFHDDKKTFKGLTTNSLGGSCGALFIGGSHTTIDNCNIYNNQTIYGGGIGIINASTLEEDEKIEVKNTVIKNNKALLSGGAIYLESNQGETTYFTNCSIIGNEALEDGSVIYTTTYQPENESSYGGNVEFTFCTIALNKASDNKTFSFYELLKEELGGNIKLKGCFVIDDSNYISESDDFNYISSKEEAISQKVLDDNDFNNLDKLSPNKGSIGDIKVKADIYKQWSESYSDEIKDRTIGYIKTSTNEKVVNSIILVMALSIIVVITITIIIIKRKKNTNKEIDYSKYSFDDVLNRITKSYDKVLTKTEILVSAHLLYDNRRKEIAQKLFVSDETIKTHLSSIYKKMNVSSKNEFKTKVEKEIF